jgi:hypothetical protein
MSVYRGCYILVYKSLERSGTDICYCMKFDTLTALNIKIMVLRDVNLCFLVERYHTSRGTCCLHLQNITSTLKMEAACTSKTLEPVYHTARFIFQKTVIDKFVLKLSLCVLMS